MSPKLIFSVSFFLVIGTAMVLSAQPVAPPPNPPARDREPHYRSKPQSQFPRTNRPNLNILADESIPPVSEEEIEDATPSKPSQTKTTVTAPRVVRVEGKGEKTDLVLATLIAVCNQEETLLSEFAITRAQNVEVKKFAQMMLHDHSVMLKKLQAFTPDAVKPGYLHIVALPARPIGVVEPVVAISDPADPKTEVEKSEFKTTVELPDRSVPDRSQLRRTSNLITVSQMLNIERELASQSLAASKEMLGEKSGLQFDESFVGHQLALHMALKNKLAVYQRYASGELAAVLAEGQAMSEDHMKRAFGLMSTLAADSNPVPGVENRIKIKSKLDE